MKEEREKRKVKIVGFDPASSVSHDHMEAAEAGHSMFGSFGSEVVGALPLETPRVAKNPKMGQTNVQFNSDRSEATLSPTHSQMLKSRRSKQSTKKRLAVATKRARKLTKLDAKVVSPVAPKKGPT